MHLPSSQSYVRMNEKAYWFIGTPMFSITFRSLHMLLWQNYPSSLFLSFLELTQGSTSNFTALQSE